MIRTRDIVVSAALLLVVAVTMLARAPIGSFMTGGQFAAVGDGFATGIDSDEAPQVTVAGDTKDMSVRERLIAKIGQLKPTQDTEPEAREEEVREETVADTGESDGELENGVIEGGVLLGDGKMSARAQAGFVQACAAPLRGIGEVKSWIGDGVWYPDLKPSGGAAPVLAGAFTEAAAEGVRIVTSTALPQKRLSMTVPLEPVLSSVSYCVSTGPVGIARDGVPIYAGINPFGEDAVAHEVLDMCGGAQGDGMYHYYGESACLTSKVNEGAPSTLVGYALDGFGIFAQTENGKAVTNNDLDACHGHEHEIPWNGQMVTKYHYHMTNEFPYSVGCFMAEPKSLLVE